MSSILALSSEKQFFEVELTNMFTCRICKHGCEICNDMISDTLCGTCNKKCRKCNFFYHKENLLLCAVCECLCILPECEKLRLQNGYCKTHNK